MLIIGIMSNDEWNIHIGIIIDIALVNIIYFSFVNFLVEHYNSIKHCKKKKIIHSHFGRELSYIHTSI